MRNFTFTFRFPATPRETFDVTTRDFEGLEKYIPNIATIRVLEHEPLPDERFRVLLRFSGEGAIPALARPLIKPDMVRWEEELVCDPAAPAVAWSLRSKMFEDQFQCRGETRFWEAGRGTRIELRGALHISLTSLPGIPDALVRRAVETVEPFLVKIAEFNLGRFYDACKRRLKHERRAQP